MRFLFVAFFIVLITQTASADPPHQYSDKGKDSQHTESNEQVAQNPKSYHPNWLDWFSAKLGVTGCGPYAVDRMGYGKEKEKPEYYTACDLDAQESTANSTRWLLLIAAIQTVITIVGTGLVWTSLKLNRDAVKVAEGGMALSVKAMEIQERTFEIEFRPILVPSGERIRFDRLGDGSETYQVTLLFQNIGKVPARIIESRVYLQERDQSQFYSADQFTELLAAKAEFQDTWTKGLVFNDATISSPPAIVTFSCRTARDIPPEILERMKSRGRRLRSNDYAIVLTSEYTYGLGHSEKKFAIQMAFRFRAEYDMDGNFIEIFSVQIPFLSVAE